MKLLFSIPSGYHLRELVLPLRRLLEAYADIESVFCITPAAAERKEIFPSYSDKFLFYENPSSEVKHRELIRKLAPDVIITNTVGHDELDFPILKAGKDLGIRTVTFIASWDNVWKIERMQKRRLPVCIADRIIVWNTMMQAHFLKIFPHTPKEHVLIAGAPRLDYFHHAQHIPSKKDVYAYLGLDDVRRPLIHFATTELYPMDYVVQAVRNAIEQKKITGNPHLYVSVHPGGDMKKHEDLQKLGATVRYSFGRKHDAPLPAFSYNPSEDDIYMLVGLFTHADVLVNHSSTTALESLIANTPVINIKYGKKFDWWHWYRSMVYRDFQQHYKDLIHDGATYVVSSKRQFIRALAAAMKNPTAKKEARERTVRRMITTTDGTASEKVLHILCDVQS